MQVRDYDPPTLENRLKWSLIDLLNPDYSAVDTADEIVEIITGLIGGHIDLALEKHHDDHHGWAD